MTDLWGDLATQEGFIIAAPDAYDPSGWDFRIDTPSFLHAVVDQIKGKHAVDASRIYLFGHSSGAKYALILTIIDADYYAATAVHAGILQPELYKLFGYSTRKMPLAIWVGDRDLLFPVNEVMATKMAFETNGFPVQFSVIPNHDHNYYSIADEVNSKAWGFLKDKQRKRQYSPTPSL